jgi:uncharacterized protein with beta-barrel porin domain
MKRFVLATVLLTTVLAIGAATAIAVPNGGSGATAAPAGSAFGNVSIKYTVGKFVKSGRNLVAKGTVVATYTPQTGAATTVKQAFTARVKVGKKWRVASEQRVCSILTLHLAPTHLNLLGLIVDLSEVNLTITADTEGGLLGRLLCAIGSRGPAATASNAQKLTKAAHKSGLATKGIGFAVPAKQGQAMQPGPCPILDLVLGPLHLNLLGLIVDLNQIHLQITADPNGGILGSLLCALAPPPATTTVGPAP